MRIAHVSDIHIRNLKFHEDYRRAFKDLYGKLRELRPDIIVNTGDTAHTKTQISPEFVQMCSEHVLATADIAPYHLILGNHDLNLVNMSRQDAITPIVESVRGSTRYPVTLYKKSGVYYPHVESVSDMFFGFWVFSCADGKENWPNPKDGSGESVKIGLYHGTLPRVEVDSGWVLKDAEVDVSLFSGLDYVLLGDIHKHQFVDQERRMAYAGSLIQQNFGEDVDKGFLVWDIRGKSDWSVERVPVEGSRKFYTVRLHDDLSVPDVKVEPGSRVRVMVPKAVTLVEQREFEAEVRRRFLPADVMSVSSPTVERQQRTTGSVGQSSVEDLRSVSVQEDLIKKFLCGRDLSDDVMGRILEINRRLQASIEQEEDVARNVNWRVERLAWSNMFNYGEGNVLDMSRLRGVIGVFAPNSAGKSSIVDILLETLFDRITKGTMKNIHMINDNKQSAQMVADVSVGDERYVVERTIERIKYGKRKFAEEKEWGKTSLNFYRGDEVEEESLNGTLRPGTERTIRRKIGDYDDFVLTSLLSQGRESDIIKCKETDRRKILSKFMDLEVFEQKERMAKEESREHMQRLRDFDGDDLLETRQRESDAADDLQVQISFLEGKKLELLEDVTALRSRLSDLFGERTQVDPTILPIKEVNRRIRDTARDVQEIEMTLDEEGRRLLGEQETLGGLRDDLDGLDISSATESLERLRELQERYDEERNRLSSEKRVLDTWDDEVSLLREVPCGDQFPTCKFLVNAFNKRDRLEGQRSIVDGLLSSVAGLNAEISKIRDTGCEDVVGEHSRISSLITTSEASVKELSLRIENLRLKLERARRASDDALADLQRYNESQEAIEHNNDVQRRIAEVESQIRSLESDVREIDSDLAERNRELGAHESIIRRIDEETFALEGLRVTCDAYEHYIEAMGRHGIAHDILVEKLPLLNDEINKILSAVADFKVLIEHIEEDGSIRLYLQYGDYRGRPLELGGGAEKMLSAIAIRTALLRITNIPKTNMLIIDEGFGSLDSKNLDNIGRMFDYLRSVFDHVIIISHIDVLKDMVDGSIEISVDAERYSHVEVC